MAGNVAVTGFAPFYTVTFQGVLARQAIPDMTGNPQRSDRPRSRGLRSQTSTVGGLAIADPIYITSIAKPFRPRNGNNAKPRVIVDGSQSGGHRLRDRHVAFHPPRADHRRLRRRRLGPQPDHVRQPDPGQLHRQVFPLPGRSRHRRGACRRRTRRSSSGSATRCRASSWTRNNTTVGGTNPQENNVIAGNGLQGVWIDQSTRTGTWSKATRSASSGRPATADSPRSATAREGVLIDGSSNAIGGAGRGGNLISGNAGRRRPHRRDRPRPGTVVGGEPHRPGPGGGFLFGTGNPGNVGDGVRIEDSACNQVGGPTDLGQRDLRERRGGRLDHGATSTGNIVCSTTSSA